MTQPGTLPFQIESKLGQGGMGAVYLARDPRTQRHVALKLVLNTHNETHLQRFLREGELTARLDHSGIVKVHHAGQHQGQPYLAYELVEGCQPLDRAFADAPLPRRLEWVAQAAEALGHAHTRGVVHRDVKPENLLVDRDGRVKVADFGLATAADLERLTRSGAAVGTPSYMAPEQVVADRGEVGPWTDVWALGVILYQALADELPFEADDLVSLAAAILHARPPRLRRRSDVPGAVAVCRKALAPDPTRRYPDGDALAADLRRALRGDPVHASPSRARPRALAATAALVALAGGLWIARPLPPPPDPDLVPAPSPADPAPAPPRVLTHDDLAALQPVERYRALAERWRDDPSPALREDLAALQGQPLRGWPLRHVSPVAPAGAVRVAFWDDETLLVYTRREEELEVWEVATQTVRVLAQPPGTLNDLQVTRAFDGTPAAVLARGDAVHWLHDTAGASRVLWDGSRSEEWGAPEGVAWDPNHGRLAAGGAWGVSLIDPDRDRVLAHLPHPGLTIRQLTFTSDGARLLVGFGVSGDEHQARGLRVWSVPDGELLAEHLHPGAVYGIDPHPRHPDRWATGDLGWRVRLYDPDPTDLFADDVPHAQSGFFHPSNAGSVFDIRFARDASLLYTVGGDKDLADNQLRVWDTTTQRCLDVVSRPFAMTSLDVSPDGVLLAVGRPDGHAELWGVRVQGP